MFAQRFFKCLLMLSVATAFGDDQSDSLAKFDEMIRGNLNDFQLKMKTGFPELNVTGFNPLTLGARSFKEENDKVAVNLNVKQINIIGLNIFDYKMKMNVDKSITLDLNFPYLVVRGLYKMQGKAFKIFPFNGEGSYEVTVNSGTINFNGKFSDLNSKVILQAGDIEFDYKFVSFRLENFGSGSSVSTLVQSLLPQLGKNILTHIEPTIEGRMKPVLNEMINEILLKDEAQTLAKKLFLG